VQIKPSLLSNGLNDFLFNCAYYSIFIFVCKIFLGVFQNKGGHPASVAFGVGDFAF